MPTSPMLFNTLLEVPARKTGKGEGKPSLFAEDTILCIENTKESTRNLLELVNKLSKDAVPKINRN